MPMLLYVGLAYLIIINIITLVVYIKKAEDPSSRRSVVLLILFPIIGGAFGACLGNFFCDTEYRELRSWLHKILGFLPPTMFIIHCVLIMYFCGANTIFVIIWSLAFSKAGWVGYYIVIINIIAFIFVIIRKSSYYVAPDGKYLISDLILVPILILGGATGGVIAKILFNFKEDWSCNALMELQNFIYNIGMFILSGVHIALYVYFFFIR